MTNLKRGIIVAFLTVCAWIVLFLALYGAFRVWERVIG